MAFSEKTRARMRDLGISVAVDNTLVVPKQPFKDPVVVTRDDMDNLRSGFQDWINRQTFENWMQEKLLATDELLARRVRELTKKD